MSGAASTRAPAAASRIRAKNLPPATRITELAHQWLHEVLRPGDTVVDATAGNGHDTVFLAREVGAKGLVHAIDIQKAAIERARERLAAAGLADRVSWINGDHARFAELLPKNLRGVLRAAVFNLGYLPGGDHTRVTRAVSTLRALDAALEFLGAAGVLCVTCYRGHRGGEEEFRGVFTWFTRHLPRFAEAWYCLPEDRTAPPVLLFARTPSGSSRRSKNSPYA